MHELEPFYNWEKYYNSEEDEKSPFYGVDYNVNTYTHTIYDHYIHPLWDFIGSDTLYLKILYANYSKGIVIIELFGEWNDTLYNDIMHLKRNVVEHLIEEGITQFILIGENVMNFHGSDDCYYEEWFEEIEDGWIAALNFRDFVYEEWKKYNLDYYINFGGNLDIEDWRTMNPMALYDKVSTLLTRRLQ